MSASASGWIWMKDATAAMATQPPLPPVNEGDERLALVDVLKEHRSLIDQVAAELANDPLYQSSKHDDLWIVRFLLSHKKNIKAAVKAAKHTLAIRAEYRLDEKDIRFTRFDKNLPDNAAVQRYLSYCNDDMFQLTLPNVQLGVVCFIDIGHMDQHGLVQNVDAADWLPSFMYIAEWSHQWTDYISRTTGRLTQSIRIMDLAGLKLSAVSNEAKKRDSNAMKVVEDCYPQMLKGIFVCHSPVWIQTIWRLARPLFPRRVVEKIDFISPDTNQKERDRLLKYIAMEHLPVRYGGTNEAWPLNFPPPDFG